MLQKINPPVRWKDIYVIYLKNVVLTHQSWLQKMHAEFEEVAQKRDSLRRIDSRLIFFNENEVTANKQPCTEIPHFYFIFWKFLFFDDNYLEKHKSKTSKREESEANSVCFWISYAIGRATKLITNSGWRINTTNKMSDSYGNDWT